MLEFTIDQIAELRQLELSRVRTNRPGLRESLQQFIDGVKLENKIRKCAVATPRPDDTNALAKELTPAELTRPAVMRFIEQLKNTPANTTVRHGSLRGYWYAALSVPRRSPDIRLLGCWGTCGGKPFYLNELEVGAHCSVCSGEYGCVVVYANWDEVLG